VSAGHGEKRSRLFEPAVLALLQQPTVALAAAACGLSEATLQRWLRLPPFAARYRAARRRLLEAGIGRLQEHAGAAAERLRMLVASGDERVALAAAKAVLDLATKGVDRLDLIERVEQLERLTRERAE
jgi:hypothetical protein